MKQIVRQQVIALTLTILSNVALAGSFPEGTFSGQGSWKSESQKGAYTVETKIVGNIVQTEYVLPDGTEREWTFEMVPTTNGLFKVKTAGVEVGEGYCIDHADVCHYEVQFGSFSLEETLTLENGKLYRLGSKDEGSGRVIWQEALAPLKK